MPAMRYTLSTADYVSDEMRAALRRRLSEIIGAALIAIAGMARSYPRIATRRCNASAVTSRS